MLFLTFIETELNKKQYIFRGNRTTQHKHLILLQFTFAKLS